MNELTTEETMTVKEVAEVLGVDKTTITRTIEKLNAVLHPVFKNSQGGYLLNKAQATVIKLELQKHHNLQNSENLQDISNDLEMLVLQKKLDLYKDKRIAELTAENAQNKLLIEQQQPKVEFFDDVQKSESELTINEVGKVLGIGQNKLFALLREKNILYGNNLPYQKYINSGYFRVVEMKYTVNSEVKVGTKPVVRQKGVDFIRRQLKII